MGHKSALQVEIRVVRANWDERLHQQNAVKRIVSITWWIATSYQKPLLDQAKIPWMIERRARNEKSDFYIGGQLDWQLLFIYFFFEQETKNFIDKMKRDYFEEK